MLGNRLDGPVRWTGTLLFALGLAAAVCPPLVAAEVATFSASSALVQWVPLAGGDRFSLTVSGGRFAFQREFVDGHPPTLSLFDADGQLLPDGTYSWELQVLPPRLQGRFADPFNGREGGRRALPETVVQMPSQSGFFSILGGRLVDPDLVEPGSETDDLRRKSGGER